ncbi:MAG: hypothetical protein GX458_03365 [Phyllobacteriaceae bacterium]|nr:hypothetical protein [Phyllobacteriaceae bacterium]
MFERDPTPSAAGPDRASIVALNGDPQRWRAICVLPAGVPVTTCGAGSGNVGTAPGAGGPAAPGGGGAAPVPPVTTPNPSAAGGLPAGQDGYDSTSIRRGDPFDGGEWANAQGTRASATRDLMPPVCISGFTLESAGSDVTTVGAKIEITLRGPYGADYRALDLAGVAIARDFSPGGSGTVISARSADFPPFRTSRVEVTMTGHGWFLMKGLRFRVVACP